MPAEDPQAQQLVDYLAAAKAALANFTISLAREMAPHGICVNSVAPGFMETDMVAESMQKNRARYLERIPLRRIGVPAEVAAAVVFLAIEPKWSITTGPGHGRERRPPIRPRTSTSPYDVASPASPPMMAMTAARLGLSENQVRVIAIDGERVKFSVGGRRHGREFALVRRPVVAPAAVPSSAPARRRRSRGSIAWRARCPARCCRSPRRARSGAQRRC